MKSARNFAQALLISIVIAACSPIAPEQAQAPLASATEAPPPSDTASPQPSLTLTATLLPVEIVEWFEHPITNLADPSITDTQVEVLIHNPNDFPVRVNIDEDELRFLNAAGEVMYTNPSPSLFAFEGEWIAPGQNAAYSACVCFQTSGLETQEWESLEVVAPLEIAHPAYTTDVEVTAEFVLLEEVVDGYYGPGVVDTLTNTSGQALESISALIFAYDASGRYVGMPTWNVMWRGTEDSGLQPGDTTDGFMVSDINYLGNQRLTYEVQAVGIIAQP